MTAGSRPRETSRPDDIAPEKSEASPLPVPSARGLLGFFPDLRVYQVIFPEEPVRVSLRCILQRCGLISTCGPVGRSGVRQVRRGPAVKRDLQGLSGGFMPLSSAVGTDTVPRSFLAPASSHGRSRLAVDPRRLRNSRDSAPSPAGLSTKARPGGAKCDRTRRSIVHKRVVRSPFGLCSFDLPCPRKGV